MPVCIIMLAEDQRSYLTELSYLLNDAFFSYIASHVVHPHVNVLSFACSCRAR